MAATHGIHARQRMPMAQRMPMMTGEVK